MPRHLILFCIATLCCLWVVGQPDSALADARAKAAQLQAAVADLSASSQQHMERQLVKLDKQRHKAEAKLRKLLLRKDSLLAGRLPDADAISAKNIAAKMGLSDSVLALTGAGPYVQRLDSLAGMLQYLQGGLDKVPGMEQVAALKARLGVLEEYQQQLQQRQQEWQQLLTANGLVGKYLPASFKKLQTQVMAGKLQLEQWKTTLNDPSKVEQEALKWLQKVPAFQRFMQQNGELARLFGMGNAANANATVNVAGLQTIQGMQQLLQQRFGNGQQVQQQLQSQLQAGMAQISQAQQQLNGLLQQVQQGGSLGNTAITPYQQEQAALKSKTFLQRFELGWNLQTGQRVRQFPASNDLALSAGYKLNPKSVIGGGIAYKFGLGTWQKIRLSHEGIGLRSFIDWRLTNSNAKLFANLWLTGGYELNYWQRMERLTGLRSLAWQQSGVIGLTKQVKVGKQTSKIQLLVDLVQLPSGQPGRYLLFRVGRGF